MSGKPGQRALRVLVVDDHQLFRTGLRELLEQEGFTVQEADGGDAALRLVPSFAPDVVLMDVNMPGRMGGIKATRLLRASAPRPPCSCSRALRPTSSCYRRSVPEPRVTCSRMSSSCTSRRVSGASPKGIRRSRHARPASSSTISGSVARRSPRSPHRMGITSRHANSRCLRSWRSAARTRRSGIGSLSA